MKKTFTKNNYKLFLICALLGVASAAHNAENKKSSSVTRMKDINRFVYQNGIYYNDISKKYRTGKIDPHVLKVPAYLTKKVIYRPHKTLPILVKFLVRGADNEYHKVKRIHDWITLNMYYNYDGFYGKISKHPSDKGNLLGRKHVCAGFANIFEWMARVAGIKNKKISGVSRKSTIPHAWNRVVINGIIYTVDTTFDCKNRYEDGRYQRSSVYTDFHLFLRPEAKMLVQLPYSFNQVVQPAIPEWDFYSSVHQTQWGLHLGVDLEAKPASIVRVGVVVKPKKGFVSSSKDAFRQEDKPLVFTIRKRTGKIKLQAFMKDRKGNKIKNNVKIFFDNEFTYCQFDAPALSENKEKETYACSIAAINPEIKNKWRTVYSFQLFRKYKHKYRPGKKIISEKVYSAKSNDFILKSDIPEAKIDSAKFYEWKRKKGTLFPFRFTAPNSDSISRSRINYRVKVPGAGYYQFYILPPSGKETSPIVNVYSGSGKSELWTKDVWYEKKWKKCGNVPVIVKENDELLISIGNGFIMPDKHGTISFEALRIIKTGDLENNKPVVNNNTYTGPTEDFNIPIGSPYYKVTGDRTFKWKKEEGYVAERLSTYSVTGEARAKIELEVLLPQDGKYQLYSLVGPYDSCAPAIKVKTEKGDIFESSAMVYSKSRKVKWRRVLKFYSVHKNSKIKVVISNGIKKTKYRRGWRTIKPGSKMFFESLRIKRVGPVSYLDRERLYRKRKKSNIKK